MSCSRKMHQAEVSQETESKARTGCGARLRLPAGGPVWTMPKLDRPGSWLLASWAGAGQVPAAQTQKAPGIKLAFSRDRPFLLQTLITGQQADRGDQLLWAVAVRALSLLTFQESGTVCVSHNPPLCTVDDNDVNNNHRNPSSTPPLGIHHRYPSRSAPFKYRLAILGKDAGAWT